MSKGTVFILVVLALLIELLLEICGAEWYEPTHLNCQCGMAQCPNMDYKDPEVSDFASVR